MNGELQSQQVFTPAPPQAHLCDFNPRLLETDAFIQRTATLSDHREKNHHSLRCPALDLMLPSSCCLRNKQREAEKKFTQPAQRNSVSNSVSCPGASLQHPPGVLGQGEKAVACYHWGYFLKCTASKFGVWDGRKSL